MMACVPPPRCQFSIGQASQQASFQLHFGAPGLVTCRPHLRPNRDVTRIETETSQASEKLLMQPIDICVIRRQLIGNVGSLKSGGQESWK
jgi:hypothetical protein